MASVKKGIGSTLFLVGLFSAFSCEDFLNSKVTTTQIPSKSVFESDATATAAALGMYEQIMENFNSVFNSQMTLCAGLAADELLNTTGNSFQDQFYTNSVNPADDQLKQYFWYTSYKYIYQANAVLEGLEGNTAISQAVSDQLKSEARLVRAFAYFYLTNLFGDVPYVITTDYRLNSSVPRSPVATVYEGITSDLINAQTGLTDVYVTAGRVRPNRAVATALLARVYLYRKDWTKAETESSKIIANSDYTLLTDLNTVFLANSKEAIWQMIPVISSMNTAEGNRFAITNTTPPYAEITPGLLAAFEARDKRRTNWVSQFTVSGKTYASPYKYKVRNATVVTEYYSILRLAEQYLIRAEAKANQGKLTEAIADIDKLRGRAGLSLINNTNPGISQSNLLLAIEQERQAELFCEWGHRWLDLKRTDRINTVMGIKKPTTWNPSKTLFPIPTTELLVNPKLVQNPGY